ncbi:hypothetical protein [Ammoniphilus resinae]|uniref:Uncharacterized protein n=1 Tax=Ammoniphilus resinae TaxID=861532 RepID=A0ABS4GPE2_9BACL|nr:hypothetical protein [Ammoniphilus resinae]MBP1931992.1 hypothetical protein [Ammoniphilus resinae]
MVKILISINFFFIIVLSSFINVFVVDDALAASQILTFKGTSENWNVKYIFILNDEKFTKTYAITPNDAANLDPSSSPKFTFSYNNGLMDNDISSFEQARSQIKFVKVEIEWISGNEKRKDVIIAK